MKSITIGTSKDTEVRIDIDRLLETRMFLCANSGAGKSWALRRLLEQTHGYVQQMVIDPEGEYRTLREKFDYVIAGRDGDVIADPRSAALLCRRLLELGTSAILDIYDLDLKHRKLFVKNFLDALVNADKSLWHNVLVIVDEVQVFAPESGDSIAAESVINLMTMGRKRGYCGILASQRISKVSKDAIAEANNLMIGRAALDIDMKRAADTLGFSRDKHTLVRALPAGHFFAFGPAISNEVTEVSVGPVQTSHPKAGQRSAPPPPAPAKIQKILAQLADLPKEADQEAASLAEAKQQIAALKRQIVMAQKPAVQVPAVVPEALDKARVAGAESVKKIVAQELKDFCQSVEKFVAPFRSSQVKQALDSLQSGIAAFGLSWPPVLPSLEGIITEAKTSRPFATQPIERAPAPSGPVPARRDATRPARETTGTLPRGELATLTAACQYPSGVSRKQLTILTGYKRSSRDAYVQRLRERGLVELSGDRVLPTDGAHQHLGRGFAPLPTGSALRDHWLATLPEGERAVFAVIINHHGRAIERELIDASTGYKRSSRDAYIQRLKARELVLVDGRGVRASAELFDE